MLTRLAEHAHRRRACPHQIAHRLVARIGNPHCCQFASSMQFGQHRRVTTVRLDPISGLLVPSPVTRLRAAKISGLTRQSHAMLILPCPVRPLSALCQLFMHRIPLEGWTGVKSCHHAQGVAAGAAAVVCNRILSWRCLSATAASPPDVAL